MPSIERVTPILVYEDIPAAHDFLVEVFGFASGSVERDGDETPFMRRFVPVTLRFGCIASRPNIT